MRVLRVRKALLSVAIVASMLVLGACESSATATSDVADATPAGADVSRPVETLTPEPPATPAGTELPLATTPSAGPVAEPPPPAPAPTIEAARTSPPAQPPAPIPAPLNATPSPTPAATAAPTPEPTEPPDTSPAPLRADVGRVETALSVDGLQRPLDRASEFPFGERIYISVEFIGVQAGAVLGFKWQSPAGCSGDHELEPRNPIRRGFFAFFINEASCPGPYDVDITVDGQRVGSTRFTVLEPST